MSMSEQSEGRYSQVFMDPDSGAEQRSGSTPRVERDEEIVGVPTVTERPTSEKLREQDEAMAAEPDARFEAIELTDAEREEAKAMLSRLSPRASLTE